MNSVRVHPWWRWCRNMYGRGNFLGVRCRNCVGNLWLWHLGLGGVEHSPCPLNCLLQCSWFGLFDHLPLQVLVQGFQHVDEERAMEVLAEEELVCLDDGL